jgi:7-carboxy-7-deazaguanine synthase
VIAVSAAAPLIEIFASVQGEGRFAGAPMTFVRTAVCPIRCLYCDTPESYTVPEHCRVGAGATVRTEPNPVRADRAVEHALAISPALAPGERRLSITGGEPLLYPDFVRDLGAALHAQEVRVHLETAALHPRALRDTVAVLDHVSADYKLPGTLERGDHRARHRECIEIAAGAGCSVDVKLVLTPAVTDGVVRDALADLAHLRQQVLLILQPVTPFGAVTAPPAREGVARWLDLAIAAGFAVRVLPQLHRVLGVP